MKKSKDSNFIWTSFTDLMTSIFFIVLILFVVTFIKLKKKEGELCKDAKAGQLVKEVFDIVQEFKKDNDYFDYNETCKRFELKQNINFQVNSSIINPSDKSNLIEAGEILLKFIKEQEKNQNIHIKFLLIIEGRAQIDPGFEDFGKKLSYERALSLYNLWNNNQVILSRKNSEVLISGSGQEGQCRYPIEMDELNRRFIIQIIPNMDLKELLVK